MINFLKRLLRGEESDHVSNTTKNQIMFEGVGASPLRPSSDFVYGFVGVDEDVEQLILSDRNLLAELGISYEDCALVVDRVFENRQPKYKGYHVIRWTNIHSPVCPHGDFCTKSMFDLRPTVTEIWLCDPKHWDEIQAWYNSFKTNAYPMLDLKRFIDLEWIMVFSDLHAHLIREHNFFEGYGTPYRLDPRKLKRLM